MTFLIYANPNIIKDRLIWFNFKSNVSRVVECYLIPTIKFEKYKKTKSIHILLLFLNFKIDFVWYKRYGIG